MLPGWNSITFTGSASNFFFWLSIGALVLLGVFEALSHFYGDRHDSLIAANYRQDKYGTDSEIARFHAEAARLTEEAAKQATDAAKLKIAVSEAQKEAAKAQLDLARFKAPRVLSPQLLKQISSDLRKFSTSTDRINFIMSVADGVEPNALAKQIRRALELAGWDQKSWPEGTAPLEPTTPYVGLNHRTGVDIQSDTMRTARYSPAIEALTKLLRQEIVVTSLTTGVPESTGVGTAEGRKNLIIHVGEKPN